MHFRTIPDRVNRYTGDARGYLRLSGSSCSPAAPPTPAPTPACRPTSGCCSADRRRFAASVPARSRATGCFDVGGTACADHLGPARRQARRDGVLPTPARPGTSAARWTDRVAPRRRRRALPDRVDRQNQPGHRTRVEDGRYESAPVVGVYVLTLHQLPRSKSQFQGSPNFESSKQLPNVRRLGVQLWPLGVRMSLDLGSWIVYQITQTCS